MKNQPNKATVKDGLTTSHNVLSGAYQRHGWLFQPDVLPSGACPHENIAMEAMQEYSDQQNAELMSEIERWKEVSELGKKSIRELIKANEKFESVESENTELRGQLISEIESREHWQRQTQRYQKYHRELNAALERVRELEGALTATLNVARAYDRSRFVDILDKAEKTLKK